MAMDRKVMAMLAIGWLCLCAVNVSLPPRHPAPTQGGRLLAQVAPGRTKTAAWGDQIRPACREVSHRPILEEASALVTAYRGLLDPAVCGASIDPEGEDEGLTPGCIREEFVPAVKECPTRFGRGICVAEPVDAGAVVIRRTPVSDIAKANTFTATERQFGQLLDTLGARDDLRCSLALWCYPDDELAEIGSVLLPFGHQGLINHGEDNEATITCPFGDEAFVKACTATRAIAAGEEIRFDYYTDFPEDPDWFKRFKAGAGVGANVTSHGETWEV